MLEIILHCLYHLDGGAGNKIKLIDEFKHLETNFHSLTRKMALIVDHFPEMFGHFHQMPLWC